MPVANCVHTVRGRARGREGGRQGGWEGERKRKKKREKKRKRETHACILSRGFNTSPPDHPCTHTADEIDVSCYCTFRL